MTDPIDHPSSLLRVELAGGTVVSAVDGGLVQVQLPAARAHTLAHLLDEWADLFQLPPDRGDEPTTVALSHALEDIAAALGDPGALACAAHAAGPIPVEQRLAAAGVLAQREPALTPAQRIAVIDGAARWMDEETGGEDLAYALLEAACSTSMTTNQTYLTLLTPRTDDR